VHQNQKCWALVPAAGIGKRFGSDTPKQYLKLHNREILAWTLQTLRDLPYLEKIILVLHPDDDYFAASLAVQFPDLIIVEGGDERLNSVANGLQALHMLAADNDWVMVHDAVRPCVMPEDINKLVVSMQHDDVGGVLASPVKDTLKRSDAAMQVVDTPDRSQYWLAATPQLFRFGVLRNAMSAALQKGFLATDEAAAVEALGLAVKLVEGRSDNIKITSPEDLKLAEFLLMQLGKVKP
tara:strand:- start:163059 stop:163772 length:714 start_codon:yes stop_codon:yes gene_type:complete